MQLLFITDEYPTSYFYVNRKPDINVQIFWLYSKEYGSTEHDIICFVTAGKPATVVKTVVIVYSHLWVALMTSYRCAEVIINT